VKELISAELDQESHVSRISSGMAGQQSILRYREKPNFVPFCIVKECFNKLRIPVGLTNTLYFAVILSEFTLQRVFLMAIVRFVFSLCLSVCLSVCSVCL